MDARGADAFDSGGDAMTLEGIGATVSMGLGSVP